MKEKIISAELKEYLRLVESEAANLQKALLSRDS